MRLPHATATFIVVTAANYAMAQVALKGRFDACKSKMLLVHKKNEWLVVD